jgi:asparagine synthetase B (glutamine-hydrolysing)
MCGILYSQDSTGFSDLEMLKRRGPEGFTEQTNELGYFAHSMLNTIGDSTPQPYHTKSGILLYNGSTYNSGSNNDTTWIGEKLDDNLDHTIDVVRELNGEYAFIYVTEKNVVFCVDHFDNRNLWIYHDKDTRQLTLASVPSVISQKHENSWRADGNKIYILDRYDFSLNILSNKVFDLDQKTNNFDHVFENFEQAVRSRYRPGISATLLSSGFDSGVVACATQKIFGAVDCVGDPDKEDIAILKERIALHKAVIIPNYQGHQEDKEKMFHGILSRNDVWDDSSVNPIINLLKKYFIKRNKKIVMTGNGSDEIYNDWQKQVNGHKWSKTNGSFPSSLNLVWPWYNFSGRMQLVNTRTDFIAGYFGLETRNPLLDVNLVQAWLNTTCKLKNSYKSWIKAYFDQEKYPYTMKKMHGFNKEYQPDTWKIIKNDNVRHTPLHGENFVS